MSSLEVNYLLTSSKGTCSAQLLWENLGLINHCPTRYLDQLVHGQAQEQMQ